MDAATPGRLLIVVGFRGRPAGAAAAAFDSMMEGWGLGGSVLRIGAKLLEDIYDHARGGVPQEVCGLLAGRNLPDGARVVERVFRVANVHPRPVGEYQLDPREQLRLTLEVEDELGLEVIGFYHSHPAGPPRFSATDAARASWPGASYFLVYLKPHEGHISARWDEEKGRFQPEDVVVS